MKLPFQKKIIFRTFPTLRLHIAIHADFIFFFFLNKQSLTDWDALIHKKAQIFHNIMNMLSLIISFIQRY